MIPLSEYSALIFFLGVAFQTVSLAEQEVATTVGGSDFDGGLGGAWCLGDRCGTFWIGYM